MKNKIIAKQLYTIDAIRFGEFILKSGKKSPIYLDLRVIISYPQLLSEISSIILDKIPKNVTRVCGVPYAALPLATLVSQMSNLPLIIKRKEVKNYGTKKIIEGVFTKGDEILLLEDVITSGESLIETITELEKEGLKISKIITLVDRQQGGLDKIKNIGYDIESCFTITTILESLNSIGLITNEEFKNIIDYVNTPVRFEKKQFPKNHKNKNGQRLLDIAWKKKSNIIASIDLCKSNDILEFIDKTHHLLCGVKLHVDIIEDFTLDFIETLKKLSYEKEFIIIEDRKFADIGNTQLLQISGGIYKISSWADFVTIHSISGESSFKAYEEWDCDTKPALIPILQMSSKGALTENSYIEKTKNFIYKYSDVVGLVCQSEKVNSRFLKFTPGISSLNKSDNKGQQYNTPDFALNTLESDFLIIGRGLYESENPLSELDKLIDCVRNTGIFD